MIKKKLGIVGGIGFNHLIRAATFSIWYKLFILNIDVKEVKDSIQSY
jgi:hypothetical protein